MKYITGQAEKDSLPKPEILNENICNS